MKLTTFLIIGIVISVSASSYSQNTKLTLNLKNGALVDALRQIEEQTDYYFYYNNSEVGHFQNVSVDAKNKNIQEVLDQLLIKTNLEYQIIDRYIVVKKKENMQLKSVTSQPMEITGSIVGVGGGPIPGATVVVKGTTVGTITDIDGNYILSDVPADATLVFSFVGMKTIEMPVNGKLKIDVRLEEETIGLEEVVAIGYGTRSKRDVTTAISSISNEAIDKTAAMSGEMAMQGRMTGVQVGSSGSPVRRPSIRIRGVNTWGISSPLYIIDGIPITELGGGAESEDARIRDVRGPLNVMTMIDPNDIESISVLKDASAAAIYGVRAANGVVLITTKKGKGDSPTLEFSSRVGIQNIVQKADVLNTQQYVEHAQALFASDPTITVDAENVGLFDPSDPKYLGNSNTYDWQEAYRVKNAPTQDYSVRISGGTTKSDYYVSGGYSKTVGAVVGSDLERYSGSFKINTQINKWLKAGVNYRMTTAKGMDDVSSEKAYLKGAVAPPWQPIYDPEGPNGHAAVVAGFDEDGNYSNAKIYGTGTAINHPGIFDAKNTHYESIRNMGSAYIEIEPVKNLKIKGQVSLDKYTTTRFNFRDHSLSTLNWALGDPSATGGGESVGDYEERDTYNNNLVKEITANYTNSFGDHNIDLLFNAMDQQYDAKYKTTGTEYMTTTLPYLRKLDGENQYTTAQTDLYRWALAGLLGRVGYNYMYKYYLDVTVRRDGSARFAPENRWGTFPSVSTAWRITNEKFMEDIRWVKDLKLRAGWGQLGNQEVRNLAYLSAITTKPSFAWGNNPSGLGLGYFSTAATVFGLANSDLQWEKTSTTNVGFDAVFFDGLNMSFEYYNKLTKGILQEVALPNSVGVTEQPVDNIASVRNAGIEISMSYSNQIGELTYSVGANVTTVKNTVESTYKGIPLLGNGIEEGYPLYYQRGYKVGGIFQSQEEVDAWLAQYEDVNYQNAKVAPGDMYFQDLRGAPTTEGEFYSEGPDGKIDSYDQVYLGKTIPGFFYGGNIDLSYKGFDFSALFTGVGDVVKYNNVRATLEYTSSVGNNISTNVYNSWTSQNTNTTVPRVIQGDPSSNFRGSDYFVESAAYLRLSNVQLGYTLPGSFYRIVENNIRYARIYLGASNLFTITSYNGFDPENDSYPVPRVFFMGLNVKF